MPELPIVLEERFINEYGFPKDMAEVLVSDRSRAIHFDAFWNKLLEETKSIDPMIRVPAANWAMMEMGAAMNRLELTVEDFSPVDLAILVARILDGTISHKIAKDIFDRMLNGEGGPDLIIEKQGLRQISDTSTIEKLVDEVLAANAKQVEDYRAGKEKAFNSLVGQVMKATKGKANPAQVNEILKKKLAG
jgi:aspartyl-tRNA(Asn)/glutamyl-tRNA(Gln) amidotransferase subunit B